MYPLFGRSNQRELQAVVQSWPNYLFFSAHWRGGNWQVFCRWKAFFRSWAARAIGVIRNRRQSKGLSVRVCKQWSGYLLFQFIPRCHPPLSSEKKSVGQYEILHVQRSRHPTMRLESCSLQKRRDLSRLELSFRALRVQFRKIPIYRGMAIANGGP